MFFLFVGRMLVFPRICLLFLLGKFSDRWALLGGAELLLLLIEDTHFVCSKTKHLLFVSCLLVGLTFCKNVSICTKNVKKWVFKIRSFSMYNVISVQDSV